MSNPSIIKSYEESLLINIYTTFSIRYPIHSHKLRFFWRYRPKSIVINNANTRIIADNKIIYIVGTFLILPRTTAKKTNAQVKRCIVNTNINNFISNGLPLSKFGILGNFILKL